MESRGRLGLTLNVGDSFSVGDSLVTIVKFHTRTQIRVSVLAPKDLEIRRFHAAAGDEVQDKGPRTVKTRARSVVR